MKLTPHTISLKTLGWGLVNVILVALVALGCHVILGGTWTNVTGAFGPAPLAYRNQALATLAGFAIVWWLVRWRWPWNRTPLDAAILLWALAFTVSLLANGENWRRTSIGLWFVGAYLLIFYALSDMVSNRKLPRAVLMDGFLLAVLPILRSGFQDLYKWWLDMGESILHNLGVSTFIGAIPRVNASLDNPNPLGTIMILAFFFALGRAFSIRSWLLKIPFLLYSVAAAFLLFISQSRGAWFGAGLGFMAGGWLIIQHYRLKLSPLARVGLGVGLIAAVLIITLGRGWSGSGRDTIYLNALEMLRDKPITGYGLYTFGQQLLDRIGLLPTAVPHAHAHNIILHVGAELGLIGLGALAFTVFLILRGIRQNWRDSAQNETPDTRQERLLLIAGVTAMIGFGVHHLFDVTATQPGVAASGMITLVVATAAIFPQPVKMPIPRIALATLLIVAVVFFGWWDNHVFTLYRSAINDFFNNPGDLTGVEAKLRIVTNDDPRIPLYLLSRSLAFHRMGQSGAAQALFNDFCKLEPEFDANRYDPQFVITQMSILQYMRFSPLAQDREYWIIYKCP